MGTKVGSIEIEMLANIARLTQDVQKATDATAKGCAEISGSIAKMQTEVQASMSKVSDAFSLVGKAVAAVAVITAGGAMFGKAVDESLKLTSQANALGKSLGITATQGSVLNVALGSVGVSSETLLTANQKLVKTLGSNEQAFTKLGVATRDSNGNFRNSLDIMTDTNTRLLSFKEGVDRNIEGQKIYGKSWAEVQGVLKLTSDKMAEAQVRAEELGLVVGKQNVEAARNYKVAMNDLSNVVAGIGKAIGDAVIPVLTDLASMFSTVGPEAVSIMKGTIGLLASAFYGLKMAVEIVWEAVKFFVRSVVTDLLMMSDIASKALKLDFAGAKAAWKAGHDAIVDDFGTAMDNIVKKATDNRDKLVNLYAKPIPTSKKEGGEHSEGGKKESQMAAFKAQLEEKHAAEKDFFNTSLADDLVYWQQKAVLAKGNAADEIAIAHELHAIQKQLAVDKFNTEQAAIQTQLAAARAGSAERISLATDAVNHIANTYGIESKQYQVAVKEMQKMAEEWDKEQEKLAASQVEGARAHSAAMIGMERERLAQQKSLGEISDTEEIAQLKKLKDREYELDSQALQDKGAHLQQGTVEYQQHLNELQKLQDKHDAEMIQLDNRQTLAIQKNWESMLSGVTGAFEKSIQGMIMGTQSLQQAMRNIGQSILSDFISMGVKKVVASLANDAAMLLSSKAKDTAVNTSAAASATTTSAKKATEAGSVVGANAAEGASGAASSQAAIPIVGPGLAIAAFAGTMALIMGAKAMIKSSAGGEWQVPGDRLNMVHKDETILPAHVATPLRNLVEGGGNGGQTHVHINTVDREGVERLFSQNGSAVMGAIRRQMRGFGG